MYSSFCSVHEFSKGGKGLCQVRIIHVFLRKLIEHGVIFFIPVCDLIYNIIKIRL